MQGIFPAKTNSSMQDRRLAAIMFTDIAGFTATMGSDHNQALELLSANRKLQKPLIESHGGRWLKEMGDGVLASFDSAYQAVKCAIDIQLNCSETLKNKIRIGIHLGDISMGDNDVFGDGVNIASRLESAADPGCILISEPVRSSIRNNQDIEVQFIGPLQFKNVSDPVNTYAIVHPGMTKSTAKKARALIKKKSKYQWVLFILIFIAFSAAVVSWYFSKDFKINSGSRIGSLAVLPFDNLTGDPEMDVLIAGMHDNLITTMSQLGSLRIISKTSTLKYADDTMSIQEIARELDVDAIVEASVLKAGDSVRINVQLIQAYPDEKHVWANVFDKPYKNILGLFNEVTRSITDEINITLNTIEEKEFSTSRTINQESYEAFLTGKFYAEQHPTIENLNLALDYFNRSIALDSSFAPAYAGVSWVWITRYQQNIAEGSIALPQIYKYNNRALELDPEYPESYYHKAVIRLQSWDWELSEKAFLKSLELNPNHSFAHAHYSHLLMYQKRFAEAEPHLRMALQLDPLNPHIIGLCAIVYYSMGEIDKALSLINKGPDVFGRLGILESMYYNKKDYKKSIELLLSRADSVIYNLTLNEYEVNGYKSALILLAKKLEQFERPPMIGVAKFYNRAGLHDEAIQRLEEAFERHDPNMQYVFANPEFDSLKEDPRYIEIAKKMNLPL